MHLYWHAGDRVSAFTSGTIEKKKKGIFMYYLKKKKKKKPFPFSSPAIYIFLPPPCAYCIQEILFVVMWTKPEGCCPLPPLLFVRRKTKFLFYFFFFLCVCVFVMIHHGYVRRVDCRTQAYGPTIQVETICTTRIYSYNKFRVNGLDNYSVPNNRPPKRKNILLYNKRERDFHKI